IAGEPQAAVRGDSGVVSRRSSPRTFAGSRSPSQSRRAAGSGCGTGTCTAPSPQEAATSTRPAARNGFHLDVNNRAGEGPGDAFDCLDLRDNESAELIDVAGLRPDDHVVRPRDVLRQL